MTQVSRRTLPSDVHKRMYDIFIDVITQIHTESEVRSLLEDFLTPTERVMLPKRLCIAYLLLKGHDQRSIASYLNVSFTTINRVSTALKVNGEGYESILTRIGEHKEHGLILEKIEEGILSFLADAGGPSNLWRRLQTEHRKEKLSR
jgi:Trp operon repressor